MLPNGKVQALFADNDKFCPAIELVGIIAAFVAISTFIGDRALAFADRP